MLQSLRLSRTLVLVLFALSALPLQAGACSCLWQGNFTGLNLDNKLVVLGEVLSHRGNSMDMAVSEVLRGKLYREEIRIWGDTGQLCRANLSEFEDNSQWLLVLEAIEQVPEDGFNPHTPNISYGRVGDFSLNRCGVYWLKYHNGYLSGNIDDPRRWLYLDPKKSPVKLELVRAFLEGRTDKNLLAKAAKPRENSELITDTRAFLLQQSREEKIREELESSEQAD